MKNITLIILVFVGLTIPYHVRAERVPPVPVDQPGKIEWLKSIVGDIIGKATEPENHFYGIVVDQYGTPVVGADVKVIWKYLSLTLQQEVKEKTIQTDNSGRFDFSFGSIGTPHIGEIKKIGYEYDRTINDYSKGNSKKRNALISQSSTTPIEFVLRKMGPTTYLYHSEGGGGFTVPSTYAVYDIFQPVMKAIDRDLSKLRAPWRYDLIFDVTKSGDVYTVNILPVQETGSMQILDQMLYEAPAGGYQPEVNINVAVGDKRKTYLYFTSRKPAVYSRMKLKLNADPEQLRVSLDTWTNPYGSRNLEYEPDLPFDLRIKLRDEAEDALKSGKLAPEPDIPAMIASQRGK